jgi:hypothetical protein
MSKSYISGFPAATNPSPTALLWMDEMAGGEATQKLPYATLLTLLQAALVYPSVASFERSDFVELGEYIGGRVKYPIAQKLVSAEICCRTRPIGGTTQIALEVNGAVSTTLYFNLTAGSGEQTATLNLASLALPVGQYLRWKVVTSGTDPASGSEGGGISITTTSTN